MRRVVDSWKIFCAFYTGSNTLLMRRGRLRLRPDSQPANKPASQPVQYSTVQYRTGQYSTGSSPWRTHQPVAAPASGGASSFDSHQLRRCMLNVFRHRYETCIMLRRLAHTILQEAFVAQDGMIARSDHELARCLMAAPHFAASFPSAIDFAFPANVKSGQTRKLYTKYEQVPKTRCHLPRASPALQHSRGFAITKCSLWRTSTGSCSDV